MDGDDGMGFSFGECMDDPLMEDQLGLGNSFPLDHEFPEDHGLDKEDDEMDIDGETIFGELPAQSNTKKKQNSKPTKAYTQDEDMLLCECWRDIGQGPNIGSEQKASTFWQSVHRKFHDRK
ncbi:Lectin-domain containing receptor kinase A4.3 [Hordeum vulgare]|nr:Lectin-domain containing receptor kinase A4.3 [Hordeum vulgare]